jgi:glycerol-3-phosphate acyltransferase PlsX
VTVVALDAMGGDHAPQATVEGAVRAAARGIEIALVGDEAVLTRELELAGGSAAISIVHAPDAIEMGDHAAMGMRNRRQSSIYVGLELVKRGEAEAFVSLGNTGAVLALGLVVLGRRQGVERPALGALLPRPDRPMLLLDVGANAECRASHLVQFAHLGAEYMRVFAGVQSPGVGLLNVGAEATKGPPLALEVHRALAASDLRFIGNVEGSGIVSGDVDLDVTVTDGFTGNVVLKAIEGVTALMLGEVEAAARDSLPPDVSGPALGPALERVRRRFDYRSYGGVPLLGVNGIVIIGHGRSDAEAIANAVGTAATVARQGMREPLGPVISEQAE